MYAALNISAFGLRLLSVKGRRVERWGNAPLAPGLVRDGLILDTQAVGEAIDALFKEAGVPKERVIISLGGLTFTYRILSLPRMKPALMEEAIQRGIVKEIPLPIEDLYLSWQVLGGRKDELDVFVLGVTRNLVDAVVDTLAVAGLEPYILDLRSLALARAAARDNAIIVALEPDCFDIVLIAKGVPSIMHTVSPRGEEATLQENIQRLTEELSKTIKFYNNSYPENILGTDTPLLLTGELSAEAGAAQFIQDEVEYSIESLVPPMQFPPDLPLASYASNMGMILQKIPQKEENKGDAARFQDIHLNIFSGKYRKPRAKPVSLRRILVVLSLIIMIGLLFPMYQVKSRAGAETMRLQDELSNYSRLLNQARLNIIEAEEIDDTIAGLAADAEVLKNERENIFGARGSFAENLQLVTEALPTGSGFTVIELDADRITVQGKTASPFGVVSYVTALEKYEKYSEVRINEIDEAAAIGVAGGENGALEVADNPVLFDIVITK